MTTRIRQLVIAAIVTDISIALLRCQGQDPLTLIFLSLPPSLPLSVVCITACQNAPLHYLASLYVYSCCLYDLIILRRANLTYVDTCSRRKQELQKKIRVWKKKVNYH